MCPVELYEWSAEPIQAAISHEGFGISLLEGVLTSIQALATLTEWSAFDSRLEAFAVLLVAHGLLAVTTSFVG